MTLKSEKEAEQITNELIDAMEKGKIPADKKTAETIQKLEEKYESSNPGYWRWFTKSETTPVATPTTPTAGTPVVTEPTVEPTGTPVAEPVKPAEVTPPPAGTYEQSAIKLVDETTEFLQMAQKSGLDSQDIKVGEALLLRLEEQDELKSEGSKIDLTSTIEELDTVIADQKALKELTLAEKAWAGIGWPGFKGKILDAEDFLAKWDRLNPESRINAAKSKFNALQEDLQKLQATEDSGKTKMQKEWIGAILQLQEKANQK